MITEQQIIEILNKTLSAHGWYSNAVINGKEKAAKEIAKLVDSNTLCCPKCASKNVIWTCYCNECNECL